jgi:hypothetical protein
MQPDILLNKVIRPTLDLMDKHVGVPWSAVAENLLLAIALQESNLTARIQGPNDAGPARSFWQFEKIGVVDVFQRQWTPLKTMCDLLVLPCETGRLHHMMAYNDMIACVLSRLTLRIDPRPLSLATTEDGAWDYYIKNWRPGKPHRNRWAKTSWPVACATTGILAPSTGP